MSNDQFPGWWPIICLALIIATVAVNFTHSPAPCPAEGGRVDPRY